MIRAITLILPIVFSLCANDVCAQKHRYNRYSNLNNDNYLSVSAFTTPLPYSYGVKAGYHHSVKENTYLNAEFVSEWGRPYELHYAMYGFDLGASYAPFNLGRSTYLYAKGTLTAGYNSIKEMKDSGKFVVGGKVGTEINYYFYESIAVGAWVNQAYLTTNTFGNQRLEYGINFKISLGW